MVHTVHRSESYFGRRPPDGREITHPTAPYLIDLGYEGIIGGQARPSLHGAKFAAEYSR